MQDLPRVLVVEDNRQFANAVTTWLGELAFDASHCQSAEDGLASLESGNYDALLLDLSLPGMNGHAMVSRLKRAGIDIPVVVMSGVGDLDDVVRFLRADIVDYLAKPFRIEELESALERALERSRTSARPTQVDNDPPAAPRGSVHAKIPKPDKPAAAAEGPDRPTNVRSAVAKLTEQLKSGDLELPVVDPKTVQLREFLSRDDYTLADVVEVVGQDTSLSGVVLRAANSAFYARGRAIESLRDACLWIGPKLVIGMALEATLRNQHRAEHEPFRTILANMSRNAFIAARIAILLCRKLRLSNESELFSLALLHNIGEPLCVQLFSQMHADDDVEISIADLDQEVARVHESFGKALVSSWGLPPLYVRFAGDHHASYKADPADEQTRQLLLAAWKLALLADYTYFPSHASIEADEHLEALGVGRNEAKAIIHEARSWLD